MLDTLKTLLIPRRARHETCQPGRVPRLSPCQSGLFIPAFGPMSLSNETLATGRRTQANNPSRGSATDAISRQRRGRNVRLYLCRLLDGVEGLFCPQSTACEVMLRNTREFGSLSCRPRRYTLDRLKIAL